MAKVTQTRDVQAQTFGFAAAINSAYVAAMAKSGADSTNLVITTAQTISTANQYNGCMLLMSSNATFDTSDTVYYGVIQSHTTGASATITVDAWYNLAGVKQADNTCDAGDFYVILPVAAPFWYIGLASDTGAIAGTETGANFGTELTSNGLGRAQADVITRTVGTTALTLAHTFTYTTNGAQAIGRCAVLNSCVANKNYAYFVSQVNSGTPATVSATNDTFTPTFTVTVG